jgi:sugar lactone lactonase YvrE
MKTTALFFLTSLSLAAGCGGARSCNPGAIDLQVDFEGITSDADELEITATIGAITRHATAPHSGGSSGVLELRFDAGTPYPAGQSITLTVTALLHGVRVGEGAVGPLTLSAVCSSPTLRVAPSGQSDMAAVDAAIDAGADGSIGSTNADLATPLDLMALADLRPPADLTPPPCSHVTVSTLAGNGTSGFVDGTGGATGTTEFSNPNGVAVFSDGTVYVGDKQNNRIRKIAPDGTTTTFSGNGTAGFQDGTGGPTGTTEFNFPTGVEVDSSGHVYVADSDNRCIRVLASDGSSTTLSGNGTAASVDGTGGRGGTTEFLFPAGIAVDGSGNVYVGDVSDYRIRKVTPSGSSSVLSGNGGGAFVDGTGGRTGTAEFFEPEGVAVDGSGNIFVADYLNKRLRRVGADGTTTTLAGNGQSGASDGTGGPTGTTTFSAIQDVWVDTTNNVIYVADAGRIRKVASNGTTTTIAGNGSQTFADGNGCTAGFSAIALTGLGKVLYVTDDSNNRIRKLQLP